MAYELVITKRRFWVDRSGPVIEERRWREVADRLGTYHLRDFNDPARLVVKRMFRRTQPLFRWERGRIHVAGGGDEARRTALFVAQELGANVQGVLGEAYYFDAELRVRHIWPDLGLPDPRQYYAATERFERRLRYVVLPIAMCFGLAFGIGKGMYDSAGKPPRPRPSAPSGSELPSPWMTDETRDAVRRGEAGSIGRLFYPNEDAEYRERAQAGDPDVRPLDQDPYLYIIEQAAKRKVAESGAASRTSVE